MTTHTARYRWWHSGDINAFFGLMLDNLAVLIILVTTITGPDKFSVEFVVTRMIPGTALGVLFGDLVYTWLALRLAKRTGRHDVTAMPLGLDTPSTFGVALGVLLPSLQFGKEKLGLAPEFAMNYAWAVGVAVLFLSGLFKIACAPFGNAVRKLLPQAGLLGSLAAIAMTLIAFLPLVLDGIASVPLVGLVALVVLLVTLVAHRSLPGHFPGALAAVLVGVVIYWALQGAMRVFDVRLVPPLEEGLTQPGAWRLPNLFAIHSVTFDPASVWGWSDVLTGALQKLPIALPFALATIVGGIDCTESAAAAGDTYDTRSILLTEGLATLLAALLGGVIQTTPYIGQPAYKKMGGRAGYTLATALFLGAVGLLGGFTFLFDWLPRAAMFPILVFVGLEITAQSFAATKPKHYPAVVLAMLPALAEMVRILLGAVYLGGPVPPLGQVPMLTLLCLSSGFIITSLLWAALLAAILDGQLLRAACYSLLAGLCALFGIIHSPLFGSPIAWPNTVYQQLQATYPEKLWPSVLCQSPYHWAGAYVLSALCLLGLSWLPSPADSTEVA